MYIEIVTDVVVMSTNLYLCYVPSRFMIENKLHSFLLFILLFLFFNSSNANYIICLKLVCY